MPWLRGAVGLVAVLAGSALVAPGSALGTQAGQVSRQAEVDRELTEGDLAFLGGDDSRAQAAFARVLALDPGCRPALWGRAAALLRLGRDYQAWELLDRALGPAPPPRECHAAARLAASGPDARSPLRLAAARRYLRLAATRRGGLIEDSSTSEELEASLWIEQGRGLDPDALRSWQAMVARRPERYAFVARPEPRAVPQPGPAPTARPTPIGGDWEKVRIALIACLVVGVSWALGLGLLFLIGDAFSRASLELAGRDDSFVRVVDERGWVGRLYRATLRVASLYYFLSICVVALLVTVAPASLIYGLASSPQLPGWAALLLIPPALICVATWVPLYRSLRYHFLDSFPGRPIEESRAPALWGLAREVAEALGTRPVDEIRVVTGSEFYVAERGRPVDKRSGRSTRCLTLGMAAFDGFSIPSARALLAHEYAHLINKDTHRLQVVMELATRLELTLAWISFWRGNAWWNLGWQFVSAYSRFFRRVARGADRVAEVLADRLAAVSYGPQPAADGLVHVIHRGVEHASTQESAFHRAIGFEEDGPEFLLRNRRAIRSRWISERIEAAMKTPPHLDQTHPTPTRRLELFKRLEREVPAFGRFGVVDPPGPERAEADLWSLFADPTRARDDFLGRCEAELQNRLDAHAQASSQRIAPLTEAILDRPADPDAYLERARVYSEMGDWNAALRDLDRVLEQDPVHARALYARGWVRSKVGRLEEADRDLRESMRVARVAFEHAAKISLGDLAAASGDLEAAVAEYGRSIELDRLNPDVFLKRANAYLRLGRASWAVADFASAAELDRGSAEAQVGLAAAREATGEFPKALAAAEAAIAIDPRLPDAHLLLARLLLDAADPARRDPSRALAHARKAVALTRGGDPEAASLLELALSRSGEAVATGAD